MNDRTDARRTFHPPRHTHLHRLVSHAIDRLSSHVPDSDEPTHDVPVTLKRSRLLLDDRHSGTRILLADVHNGEMVDEHPDVATLLQHGWHVHSTKPRIIESGRPMLLVIMRRPHPSGS